MSPLSRWSRRTLLLLCSLLSAPVAALAKPPAAHRAPTVVEHARRADGNNLSVVLGNDGSIAYDVQSAAAGLEYPRGSGKTAVFAAGLWLASGTDVALSDYASDFRPGAMLAGGAPDDPAKPEYKVYKVVRYTGLASDTAHVDDGSFPEPLRHHSWSEYMQGAAAHGAPWKLWRLPDTGTPDPTDSLDIPGPDVTGDQMLWCVYNDADAAAHRYSAQVTPLGIEVQQTVIVYDRPGPLSNAVYVRYVLVNKGTRTHAALRVSFWSDPDLGEFTDDLIATDVPRGMGYVYNASNSDAIYGTAPPAVGFDVLSGLSGCYGYLNGVEPTNATETANVMSGLRPDGSQQTDPTTLLPTPYWFPGDPIGQTGWNELTAGDKRSLQNGPLLSLAPGDSDTVWVALVVGQGPSRLQSVADLRSSDGYAQLVFGLGFPAVLPPPPGPDPCLVGPAINCPRSVSFWREECLLQGAGLRLAPGQLAQIATAINAVYGAFDWTPGSEANGLSSLMLSPSTDARTQALQHFAALAASQSAWQFSMHETNGACIQLVPSTPLSAVTSDYISIATMLAAVDSLFVLDTGYLDLDATHEPPFGAASGVPGLGGLFGEDAIGSTIPAAQQDSFPVVELRFDGTQKGHRFLRTEGGSFVSYLYAGYFDVPFTAWDITHGVQLDVGFLERGLVDANDVFSPDTATIATFDRTWGPSDEANGGRERLFIFSRPYSGVPRDEFRPDDALLNGTLPVLYGWFPRRLTPASQWDAADRVVFTPHVRYSGGADSALWALRTRSLLDPAVVAEYQRLTAAVAPVTRGEGIGVTCDVVVAVQVSLVEAIAEPGFVRLRWQTSPEFAGAIERREGMGEWTVVGAAFHDGRGHVNFEDRDVEPGATYAYRLRWDALAGNGAGGEVQLTIPLASALQLAGFRPNPAGSMPQVAFRLPERGSVRLEVLDVTGRRRFVRDYAALAAGEHVVPLEGSGAIPAGVYFLRLSARGRSVTLRGVLLR